MGRAALLIVTLASGCAVTFGDQSDCACRVGEVCFATGQIDPSDPCRECRPDRSTDELTDACDESITETSFADFSDGTMPRSLGNLYTAADGSLRVVNTSDPSGDGWPDLVFSNFTNDASGFTQDSYLYLGSERGFSLDARISFPTNGAVGNAIADLDADGYADLVFANHIDDLRLRDIDSTIYYGGPEGFDPARRQGLPTRGAHGCAVGDLDNDGHLDIVFANIIAASSYLTNSFVYWGSPEGYSAGNRTDLPTIGPTGVSIADLDRNGHLDVVFSSYHDGVGYELGSLVYWGSPAGFSADARTALPTHGSSDNTIADVNADGYLDIAFSSYFDGTVYTPPSLVYLGGPSGFSAESRIEIPTVGAWGTSIADLDRDGALDYVFASLSDGTSGRIDSLAFRGSAGGMPVAPAIGLPTTGAVGAQTVDVDLDGWIDVVIVSQSDGVTSARDALVFHGGEGGPSPNAPTPLPTIGAHVGTRVDLGNLYDRSDVEEYVSSPIELPGGAIATRLSWLAETPHGSSVVLSLRSAEAPEELESAEWLGPTPSEPYYERPFTRISDEHAEHRYLQYRVTFRTPGFVGLPVVHAVSVHYIE